MITKYFRLFLFFFLIGNLLISCKNKSISTRLVSVSILPQKYLTEQIAGDYLTVNVMIPPGMNPATCDLSTEQLKKLYDSDLCFTIGYLPFEQIHLFPVLENRPDIQIVNHSANLQLIHGSCGHTHAAGDEHDGVDPHIWLSPAHARTMATTVYEVLSEKYPEQKLQFEQNYQALLQKIDSIADRVKQVLDQKRQNISDLSSGFDLFCCRLRDGTNLDRRRRERTQSGPFEKNHRSGPGKKYPYDLYPKSIRCQ